MKRFILSLVLGLALGGFSATDAAAQGGGLNIGVVDMQECLNQYYKTKTDQETKRRVDLSVEVEERLFRCAAFESWGYAENGAHQEDRPDQQTNWCR